MTKNKDFRTSNLSSPNQPIPQRKKEKKPFRTFLKILLAFLGVIIIFFLSVGMISGFKGFFDTIKQSAIFSLSNSIGEPMQRDQYNSVNVLLLGYGGATHQGGFLTDSIMVASWNPDENNVTLFSVPRDLYVKSPVNGGYGRINAIFQQYYNRTKSIEESALGLAGKLEEILGLEIPYYATIDFQAFKEIVDLLGGVDVYVTETIYDPKYPADNMIDYDPFYIESGWQHLDGPTALKYARSRHTTSDFARSLRQQELIIAIKDKLLESGLSVSTASDLYNQYKSYVQTNIPFQEMLWTVQFLPKIKGFSSFGYTSTCGDRDVTRMVPGCFLYNPNLADFNGMAVLLPDGATSSNVGYYNDMQTFVTFILTHRQFLNEGASVEIVNSINKPVLNSNGFGKSSIATRLGVKMVKYGLNVTNVTNGETPTDHSYIVVNMVGDFTGTIEAIQEFLPIQDIRVDTGSVQVETYENGEVEYWTNRAYISVVLGDDYILGNEYFSGLSEKKFSYKLDIDPIPPLVREEENKPE